MKKFILCIDQGTTSSRVILYNLPNSKKLIVLKKNLHNIFQKMDG